MIQNKLAELKALRKNKKGFTLVEIIVVLAILAILIGALTPTMLAFIDDARGKAMVAEARVGIVAAQMCYMENRTAVSADTTFMGNPGDGTTAHDKQFKRLTAELAGDFTGITYDPQGHVTAITYTSADGKVVVQVTGGVTSVNIT